MVHSGNVTAEANHTIGEYVMTIFHGIPTNVYVDVEVMSDKEGNIRPLTIIWRDGSRYNIDKVYRAVQSILPQGGEALCYECRIKGHRKDLYFSNGSWFVIIDKPLDR